MMYMAEEWLAAAAKSELLEATAGEGRTVNRDWSNKHRGRFSRGKILLVLVVIGYNQSINHVIKLEIKSQYKPTLVHRWNIAWG